MNWEYLGAQELSTGSGFVHVTLRPPLWRAAVPGGWFVVLGHTTIPFFYPDPEHCWNPADKSEGQMLLRPAMGEQPAKEMLP